MELKLYSSFPDELKNEWNDLLAESITHVPFLRYEYLRAWWETRGGGEWPETAQLAIITARADGRLVGVAPLFVADWEGAPTLLLLGSIEISDYLDLIVRPQDLAAFSAALLEFLNASPEGLPDWQRLDFYNVLDSSPLLEVLKMATQARGWQYQNESFRPSLMINLPGDWEQYLAGIDKKQRHEIRRKMRRASGGEQQVAWSFLKDPADLEPGIDAFLHLMELDPEKAAFLTPAMRQTFRSVIRCAFENQYLGLAFLEINGQKAAAYLAFDYLNQLWVYNSGMDNSFTELSPGWVLLGELLKWANESGHRVFDFMRGDEDYKFRFGALKRDVLRLTVTR
jgi:CelD/BcsL family acetyltransferase involved in cellulose biosynthesis